MMRVLAPRTPADQRTHGNADEHAQLDNNSRAHKRRSLRSIPLLTAAASTQEAKCPARTPITAKRIELSTNQGWDVPHLTRTPWEAERRKKHASWRRSKVEYQFPARYFQNLPREVYDCILAQLEQIHLGQEQPCPTCYLQDLSNLSLVSRAWDKATTSPMYQKIKLLANEEHTRLPKLKTKGTSRLKLLRRTLRERVALARYVRELHLSDIQSLYENATIGREEIVNLVASLVMACPFLERLVGFNMPYNHSFDRLSHALSMKPNLRERVWRLSEKDLEYSDDEEGELGQYYTSSCDPTERFLELHAKHPLLSTLVLHQDPYQASISLNFRFIIGTLRQLPALRHLSISGLAFTSFTNMTLNALPPNLHSLRLENLPGINDKGLQRFAGSSLVESISKLTLIDIPITNLVTISYILSARFQSLSSFSIAQQKAPGLASHTTLSDFYSPRLEDLHWEFRSEAGPLPNFQSSEISLDKPEPPTFPFVNPEPICCLATSVLATSIQHNGFPSLRRIRIPHDPQGIIQALCKPLATALLPSDGASIIAARLACRIASLPLPNSHAQTSTKCRDSMFGLPPSPRADSAIESPTSSTTFEPSILTPSRSRLAAQSRILAARKEPLMTVRVYNPNGDLQIDKAIKGFLGQVGSRITYRLTPDRGRRVDAADDDASNRNEWVTGIDDLVGRPDPESQGPSFRIRAICGHPDKKDSCRNPVRVDDIF